MTAYVVLFGLWVLFMGLKAQPGLVVGFCRGAATRLEVLANQVKHIASRERRKQREFEQRVVRLTGEVVGEKMEEFTKELLEEHRKSPLGRLASGDITFDEFRKELDEGGPGSFKVQRDAEETARRLPLGVIDAN